MAASEFECLLETIVKDFDEDLRLRDKQIDILKAMFLGKDVMASLPTGYGKSMIFHLSTRLLRQRNGNHKEVGEFPRG